MRTTEGRRLSPAIVRAWFDTVLNPLIRGLQSESSLLSEGNLTWRLRPPGLASLVGVRVRVLSDENLGQFLDLHPEIAQLVEKHDRECDALSESCRTLETRLVQSREMRTVFDETTAPDRLPPGTDVARIFGAYGPEDYLNVLAEDIINGVERLPSYYTTAEYWNLNSRRFLALRDTEEIRPFWRKTNKAAKRLAQTVEVLTGALRKVRNDLSLLVGVPIVEQVLA